MKSSNYFLTALLFFFILQIGVGQIPPEILQPEDTTFFQIFKKIDTYYTNNPIDESENEGVSEGGDREAFYKWAHHWENRIGLNGTVEEGAAKMSLLLNTGITVCDTPDDNHINWRNLGPHNSSGALGNAGGSSSSNYCLNRLPGFQNQGRIDVISVHPDDSNIILAGSPTGGIWRTIDGGVNWSNVTDAQGYTIVGISDIVRHPVNPSIIYASTGTGINSNSWNLYERRYGVGIIMSDNDGVTWQPTGFNSPYGHNTVRSLAIAPNSTISNTVIYAGTGGDLYRFVGSSDALGAWTSIFSDRITDLEVESNGVVWFGTPSGIFRIGLGSTPPFLPIISLTLPAIITNCVTPVSQDIRIDITRQDHVVLLMRFMSNCSSDNDYYLYRTTDSGITWDGGAHILDDIRPEMHFAVSRENSTVIYTEKRNGSRRCVRKITNCFASTAPIIIATDNRVSHVDIRYLGTYDGDSYDDDPNGDNDEVYLGTDGGMARTTDGFTWMDITGEGLACTNFIGVGVTETNSDYIFCGAMDGNINFYNEGEWFETRPGGDNGDVLIDPTNITRVYQQYQSTLKRTTVTGNNTNDGTSISPPAGNGWLFPMIMNPNNSSEIFAGTHGLHFTSNADANLGVTWTTIPTPNPFYANNKTSSVAMSANNSDVVYYSVRGYWHEFPTTLPDGSLNEDNFGAIYRAERINGNWVVTDITNNIRTRCISTVCGLAAPISDIAVDPNDEDNIWVTLGSFSDGDKVFNTTDGGANWVNVSSCLPNIPMTAVVVQGGSNNRVYVGSDYGVFYKDDSMTDWAYYGNNGPKSVVYDMEINYCGNKIVVGTHGRGLWEADLINSEDDAVTLNSGTTNWTTPKSLYYDYIVPQGATLNITGATINIAEGVKIIVEKGARLNISNQSKLTNGCGDLWHGIEVRGDPSFHQGLAQGRLTVSNSTIEYARNAVRLGNKGKNGGYIFASNTTFRNNIRAVEFLKYRNFNPFNPSITNDNVSTFTNCTFITDEDLPDNETPTEFVKMWQVDNVKFQSCDFMNTNPNATSLQKLGRGIYTLDASFTVTCTITTGVCPGPVGGSCCDSDRPIFMNLEYGVFATNQKSARSFKVDAAYFENCRAGVYFRDVDFAQITRSDFEMGYTSASGINVVYGIVNNYGTQYKIEENNFTASAGSPIQTYGTVMVDTGTDNNEIYNNEFENMTVANWAFGDNGSLNLNPNSNTFDGLVYFCNEHTNSRNDIAVRGFFNAGDGIRHYQGGVNGSNFVSAGNTFSDPGNPIEGHILNHAIMDIIYYHSSATNETPSFITQLKVVPVNPPNLQENTCLSSLDPLINDPKDKFLLAEQSYLDFKEEYDTKIDNGNTDDLLTTINNSNDNLKDILLDASPYLSVAVLEELINIQALNNTDLYDVLVANPDVLRQPAFKENLSNQSVLDNDMLNNLFSASSTITDRGKLEMSKSYFKAEMNKYARDVIHSLLSLPDEEKTDEYQTELLNWMETNQSLPAMYNRIDYLKNSNQDVVSLDILSSIPNIFELSENENLSYQSLNQIYNLVNQVEQDNRDESELTENELTALEILAEDGNGRGKIKARNILSFFYGNKYPFELYLPEEDKSKENKIEAKKLFEEVKSVKVEVNLIPNPASNELNIQYISPSIYGNTGEILIVNMQGQELFKGKIDGQNQEFLLNVSKWTEGMYYCIYKPTSSSQKIIPFVVRHDN